MKIGILSVDTELDRMISARNRLDTPRRVPPSRVMKRDRPMPQSTNAPPTSVVVHRDLAYVSGAHPRQMLDLYVPDLAHTLLHSRLCRCSAGHRYATS
jgi:hypothetical protein